jgi:hypothetical protein
MWLSVDEAKGILPAQFLFRLHLPGTPPAPRALCLCRRSTRQASVIPCSFAIQQVTNIGCGVPTSAPDIQRPGHAQESTAWKS